MTTTSSHPILVDGVRLDTLAWNIEKVNRQVAARRSRNVEVPGRDGVLPSVNDDLEPARLGLEMFVMGTDADGAVPGGSRRNLMWQNLDELVHLFGKRHALLEVRETVANGAQRRAWAKVEDTLEPDLNEAGSSGRFTVGLLLPYATWEDVDAQTWTATSPVYNVPIATLDGGTERVMDAVIAVKGPVTNPRITDPTTMAYVQLLASVPAGQTWRLNCETWATRVGNIDVNSTDLQGTDMTAVTFSGGATTASALPLTMTRQGGTRRALVTMYGSAGTVDGVTAITVKARRKYAL